MNQRLSNSNLLFDIIWFCLLALYVNGGMHLVPLYSDESLLIFMGRDYNYHFIEGDFEKLVYEKPTSPDDREQHFRLMNGTLPKYIYGWLTHINGFKIEDLSKTWDWSLNYRENT